MRTPNREEGHDGVQIHGRSRHLMNIAGYSIGLSVMRRGGPRLVLSLSRVTSLRGDGGRSPSAISAMGATLRIVALWSNWGLSQATIAATCPLFVPSR